MIKFIILKVNLQRKINCAVCILRLDLFSISILGDCNSRRISFDKRKSGMRNSALGALASLLEFSRRNARSAVWQLACFIAEVAPVLISIYTVVDVAVSQSAGSR